MYLAIFTSMSFTYYIFWISFHKRTKSNLMCDKPDMFIIFFYPRIIHFSRGILRKIYSPVGLVLYEPQQVEARQQRGRQLDVLLDGALGVVAPVRGVGGRQDRHARVQARHYTRLTNLYTHKVKETSKPTPNRLRQDFKKE